MLVILPVLLAYVTRRLIPEIQGRDVSTARRPILTLAIAGVALVFAALILRSDPVRDYVLQWRGTPESKRATALLRLSLVGKLTFLLGLIPVLLSFPSFFSRRWRTGLSYALRDTHLGLIIACSASMFLLTMPTLLWNPIKFGRDVVDVAITSSHYKTAPTEGNSFAANTGHLINAVGLPAALLGAAGLPFFFRRDARHLLIMLAFALPYFFILSTWTRSAVRWMLPCIPILAVGVGLLVDRSASLRDLRWLRISVCSLVAVLTVVRGSWPRLNSIATFGLRRPNGAAGTCPKDPEWRPSALRTTSPACPRPFGWITT